MAMANVYLNQISSTSRILRDLLAASGEIERIDILWAQYEAVMLAAHGGGADAAIQAELDEVASFASNKLTLANVRDAVYIVKQARAAVETINLVSATIVANLA